MKNSLRMFISLFILLRLVACNTTQETSISISTITPFVPRSTNTPNLSKSVPSETVTIQPTSPVSTVTVTPKPAIQLSKVYELADEHVMAWFPKGDRYAILLDGKLAVYTISHELVWSWDFEPIGIEMSPVVAVSSDGKYVIAYTINKGIVLFDALTGDKLKSYQGNCFVPYYADFIIVQDNLVYVGFHGDKWHVDLRPIQVSSWRISPLKCNKSRFSIPVSDELPALIHTMEVNSDYLFVVSTQNYNGVNQGRVNIFDVTNNKQICETDGVYAAFNPAKGYLAVLNNSGDQLFYWDVKGCKILKNVSIPGYDQGQEMTFTSDGDFLIMRRKGFQVFQSETGKLVFELTMDIDNIFGTFAISPNGKYLYSTYADNSMKSTFWEIER